MNLRDSVKAGREGWHAWMLAALLVVAALLRFRALDWGLTQTPHIDERYFVGNVARMLATGSLDHGYYEYPGLLFYLLMPVLKLAGVGPQPDASAYLAARAFIAACGVAGVAGVYLFGRRLLPAVAAERGEARPGAGRGAALAAAAFATVSPLHVETAHMLRPDVPLELLALLAFAAFLRLGTRLRDDGRAGMALGLALGLKFSAGLLAAVYLLRRGLRPGPRLRGALLAAVAGTLTFAAVSPYAWLHHAAFVEGVDEQLSYHYERAPEAVAPFAERLAGYAAAWLHALGPLGALLAAVGLVLALRRGARTWLPFLVLPPLTALVFASTGFVFVRHMLPSLGLVALLAGLALEALAARHARLAVVVALCALAFPLHASLRYLEDVARPSTRDRVAAWLETALRAPARVLTTLPSVRLDPRRFEVQRVKAIERVQLLDADAIVTTVEEESAVRNVFRHRPRGVVLRPSGPYEGVQLFVRLVPRALHSKGERLPLAAAELRASTDEDALANLCDGRLDTYWRAGPAEARGAWIQATLPAPARLTRVELLLGERTDEAALNLHLRVSHDGLRWRLHDTADGRPAPAAQLAALGYAEVLLFEPVDARALRLERRAGAHPWSVAELRLYARR